MIAYTFIFLLCLLIITVLLASLQLDFVTSLSGALTSLTNVGPGLGDIIGPAGNFGPLPDAAKWILSVGMLMGRLEDRKSTRLNSSHVRISYAVFCLKKKK